MWSRWTSFLRSSFRVFGENVCHRFFGSEIFLELFPPMISEQTFLALAQTRPPKIRVTFLVVDLEIWCRLSANTITL